MGKYLHKSKTKVNIPVCIAVLLLCLTLFSSCLVSGLSARYAVSGQSGGYARVAKFSIEGSGFLSQFVEADVFPGGEKKVDLVIQNNSEVGVEYEITVTNETNNLPLKLSMEKDGASIPGTDDSTITLTGKQLSGSYTDTYTLFIHWDPVEDDPAVMGMVDHIAVKVTAVQID